MIYTRTFYTGVGYLMYALVMADGVIEESEAQKMSKTLLKKFSERDMTTRGNDVYAAINKMYNEGANCDTAFEAAMTQFKEVPSEFTHAKAKLLDVLNTVALADKVKCEAEQAIINKLANVQIGLLQ